MWVSHLPFFPLGSSLLRTAKKFCTKAKRAETDHTLSSRPTYCASPGSTSQSCSRCSCISRSSVHMSRASCGTVCPRHTLVRWSRCVPFKHVISNGMPVAGQRVCADSLCLSLRLCSPNPNRPTSSSRRCPRSSSLTRPPRRRRARSRPTTVATRRRSESTRASWRASTTTLCCLRLSASSRRASRAHRRQSAPEVGSVKTISCAHKDLRPSLVSFM